MKSYKISSLENYIKDTSIVNISNSFKIRMNNEELNDYNNHLYDIRIKAMKERIDKIKSLDIKYPYNSNPTFYLYIVPKENFRELLDFPSYIKSEWGGKPVRSFDIDGFKDAYAQSNNILLWNHPVSINEDANSVHELAHLVHGMFFNNTKFLCEGFADAITFYILDYEEEVDGYKELLLNIKEEDILNANQLIEAEDNNTFNSIPLVPNKWCSFSKYYISSYLFVRSCIEKIEKDKGLTKKEALQELLNIMYNNHSIKQNQVFRIADELNIDKDTLLNSIELQIKTLNNIKGTN